MMMCTGLVGNLQRKDFDVARWLKEDMVRLYGLCCSLRDEVPTLTEKEIYNMLNKYIDHMPPEPLLVTEEMARERYEKRQEGLKKNIEDAEIFCAKISEALITIKTMEEKFKGDHDSLIGVVLTDAQGYLNSMLEANDPDKFRKSLEEPFEYNEEYYRGRYEAEKEEYEKALKEQNTKETEVAKMYKEYVEEINELVEGVKKCQKENNK